MTTPKLSTTELITGTPGLRSGRLYAAGTNISVSDLRMYLAGTMSQIEVLVVFAIHAADQSRPFSATRRNVTSDSTNSPWHQ
jgi:uncharacterized protein (DUF433 family)